MESFNQLISNLSSIVWGPPMLILIVLAGVLLTYKLRFIKFYRMLWVCAIVVGATGGLTLVWNIADVLNAMMALPNLIALIALSGVVVAEARKYWAKNK